MNNWSKLKVLNWDERRLLMQAALLLPATALAVRSVGVKRWQKTLGWLFSTNTIHSGHLTSNSQQRQSFAANERAVSNRRGIETTGTASALDTASVERSKQAARTIARLVRAAANYGSYRANCLEQSLVLWSLLKRAGLASEIRYGARKEEEQLHAHAWVECLGLTLNEDRGVDQRFAPFSNTRMGTTLASTAHQDL